MNRNSRDQWQINTRLNHPVRVDLHEGNTPLISPVYLSAKYTPSENYPYWDQFIYSRVSNPTTRQLELTLADIQQREDCLALSSGIAALTVSFLSLLKQGDHIITFRELYKPARQYIRDFLPRYGIESSFLSLGNISELSSVIKSNTKLIHFESPSNPNLQIADIDHILQVAKKNNILVSMDGTFAGLHQHREYDVDLMIQSLTKFANGHGDVIAGSISGKKDLMKKVKEVALYIGASLDPQSAYYVERGLKTYMLRYEKQTKTSLKVAQFLSSHPKVKSVRYPGLENHPEHQLAKKQMKDMGAVIAFEIDNKVAESADVFCHRLSLIQLAASLGSTETIICPTQTFFGLDLSEKERSEIGINSHSLRLSVGLEEPEDIIRDLSTVLDLQS